MLYHLSEILRDTRIHLDYNEWDLPLVRIRDSDTLTLNQVIKSKILPATREVLLEASPCDLAPGKPVPTQLLWPQGKGCGMAILPLPDDFLRMLTVRLSDWERPARVITDADPEYRWQASRFPGVRGNPSRPIAVITQDATGVVAELYASNRPGAVELSYAQYVPMPAIIDQHITLPGRLYDAVIDRITALCTTTFSSNPTNTNL